MNNSNLEKNASVVGGSFLKWLKRPSIVKGLLVTGLLVGGVGDAMVSRDSHVSNSLTLEVNCENGGPNAAVAGGLNDPQEMHITVKTPEGTLQLTAKLGKYSLKGVQRSDHPAGQILANMESAEVVAGAPDQASNTYNQSNQSITLICNGVQPKNISGGY